jgi:hypothetical protein
MAAGRTPRTYAATLFAGSAPVAAVSAALPASRTSTPASLSAARHPSPLTESRKRTAVTPVVSVSASGAQVAPRVLTQEFERSTVLEAEINREKAELDLRSERAARQVCCQSLLLFLLASDWVNNHFRLGLVIWVLC